MSRIFGGLRQLAMVVPNADIAMAQWVRLGVGPFHVVRRFEFQDYVYRGQPGPGPIVTLCFAQAGPLQIEIIEQHNQIASAYTEFLAQGQSGCQHVASWFSEPLAYDAAREQALAEGLTLIHEGCAKNPQARFAYFATDLPGGLMLELAEALLPEVRALVDMTAQAAENWDGEMPIRNLN